MKTFFSFSGLLVALTCLSADFIESIPNKYIADSAFGTSEIISDTAWINRLILEAKLLENSFKYEAALLKLDTVEKLLLENLPFDSFNYAQVLHLQGNNLYRLQNLDGALERYEKALAIWLVILDPINTKIAGEHFGIANVSFEKRDLPNAHASYLKALYILGKANPQDSLKICMTYFSLGNVTAAQENLETARSHFLNALSFMDEENPKHLRQLVAIYLSLGDLLRVSGNYSEAEITLQKAYSILNNQFGRRDKFSLGVAANSLGNLALNKGEPDKAISFFEEGLALMKDLLGGASPRLAIYYLNIGNGYYHKGDFRYAEKFYRVGLDILLNSPQPDQPNTAKFYASLAKLYSENEDYPKAIDYLLNAQRIFQLYPAASKSDIAFTYMNLGIELKNLGKYQEALVYHEKAMTSQIALYGHLHSKIAFQYLNISNVLSEQGHYNSAIDTLQKALDILRQSPDNKAEYEAEVLTNLAFDFRKLGRFDQAIENLQTAKSIYVKRYGFYHPKAAYITSTLFETFGMNNDYDSAEPLIQQALDMLRFTGTSSSSLNTVLSASTLVKILYAKGNFYLNWHKQVPDKGKLVKAYHCFSQALVVLDQTRQALQSDESRLILSNKYLGILEGGINTMLNLKQTTDSLHYWHKAFEFSEKSKSLLLYESMQHANALKFGGIPDSLIDREQQLSNNIRILEKKRTDMLEAGALLSDKSLLVESGKIFNLGEQNDKLIAYFENHFPDYFRLKYNRSMVSIQEVQSLLLPAQTLLEYFIGDSSIYIFVVKRANYQVIEVKKDFPLVEWIEQIRTGIRTRENKDATSTEVKKGLELYVQAAYNLYQKILSPVVPLLDSLLIIVPDAELTYLPFEALLTEVPTDLSDTRSYAYFFLSSKKIISYAQSATLLREMTRKIPKVKALEPCLAMAPFSKKPTTPVEDLVLKVINRRDFGPLLHSGEEVAAVAALSHGLAVYDSSATTHFFLKNVHRYRLLHLSQHAVGNKNVGNYSFILFSDALLYVRDIYNLEINADMVVLSACETGYGELKRGEGIVGMARAFTYAGAKSLFVTLWSVSDRATSVLSKGFYTLLFDPKNPLPKDRALREVKMSLIQDKKYSHPYYWAGMIGIGDMRAMKN